MRNRRKLAFVQALAPAVELAKSTKSVATADMPGLALRNEATDLGQELLIYGAIGGGFWSEGITAAGVAELLSQLGPKPVHVRINSGGGDVFQGTAIYSLLAQHPGLVTVTVDGLAASAASIIMLAGDVVRTPKHAFVMIHDAMTYTYGNGDSHRGAGELLDKVSGTLAEMYADKAGEDADYWRAKMTENAEDGTWYTGQEAVDVGLADEVLAITTGEDAEDEVAARLSGWVAMMPAGIRAQVKVPAPVIGPETEEPIETVQPSGYTAGDHLGRDLAFAMLAANIK